MYSIEGTGEREAAHGPGNSGGILGVKWKG